jgi:hypothetical protein
MSVANPKKTKVPEVNPHQDAINRLAAQVLPRVRQMPFAKNSREPWLGNAAVDKAVIATIETIFALADETKAAADAMSVPSVTDAEPAPASEPVTEPAALSEPQVEPQSTPESVEQPAHINSDMDQG